MAAIHSIVLSAKRDQLPRLCNTSSSTLTRSGVRIAAPVVATFQDEIVDQTKLPANCQNVAPRSGAGASLNRKIREGSEITDIRQEHDVSMLASN